MQWARRNKRWGDYDIGYPRSFILRALHLDAQQMREQKKAQAKGKSPAMGMILANWRRENGEIAGTTRKPYRGAALRSSPGGLVAA
jgi:predicted nucleic acid-binding Zn ribbon protein